MTSKCQCCSSAEDMNHVFITGPIASKVWMYFDNIFNVNYYYANIPIKELLELWFIPTRGHIINLVSSLIIWYIWMARNNSIYNNIGMNADNIIRNITNKVFKIFSVKLLKDKNFKGYCHIAKVFGINLTSNSNTFSPRIVCWITPVNFVKLNTDGLVKDNGWGCGGIIRDFHGNLIMFYGTPLEKCFVILAELSAILHGLKLCSTLDLVNIWIEVDAMYMLYCLKDKGDYILSVGWIVGPVWDVLMMVYHLDKYLYSFIYFLEAMLLFFWFRMTNRLELMAFVDGFMFHARSCFGRICFGCDLNTACCVIFGLTVMSLLSLILCCSFSSNEGKIEQHCDCRGLYPSLGPSPGDWAMFLCVCVPFLALFFGCWVYICYYSQKFYANFDILEDLFGSLLGGFYVGIGSISFLTYRWMHGSFCILLLRWFGWFGVTCYVLLIHSFSAVGC
ncbi:hypothetical protein M5K25_026065 [Dendrobium thyrsiflorum]|uniref:RNase H type-1 domain-containing protein n=1 Tax=Dendrobium thyrsiflorum TaxID=117978 RepID=A0ABD0TWG5_DENTH